ncbi:MAG: hypothetical protein KGL53_07780, partial [Elusimicrobia bacterium]|nr:hypothetical protein [Elusimicrobiota bacterium]
MRGLAAALLAAALLAAPARADLDFTQVTEAQTSAGAEGLFGKTWVELRGPRMRLVSGYARKLETKGRTPPPTRRVQILDVKDRTRTVVDPKRRSYSVGPLSPPDYGAGMERVLERGAPEWRIVESSVTLARLAGTRRILGADCEHWQVSVTMRLTALNGRVESARMDQHLWTAPLRGELAESLMELIAFENAYRAGTGGELSPLDHERYQVREAAAYLQVPEKELAGVVSEVRERLRGLPTYPVASSVAWWRDEGASVRPPQRAPNRRGRSLGSLTPLTPRTAPPARPPVLRPPAFKVIDWTRAERRINGMYRRTRSEFGRFPLGPLQAPRALERPPEPQPPVRAVPRYGRELRGILDELLSEEMAAAREA